MDQPLHITCPHCDAVNRLAATRLSEAPNCGRCHQALFVGKPFTMTDANARTLLSRNDLPLVIDCWATWCGPCVQFAPIFDQAAAAYEPRVRFAKLDTDAQPQTSAQFQIRSIPTLILYGGGKEIARQSGALSYGALSQWLMQHLQA